MAALLDIYAKLIIAFVSFIAPLMVYLLSVSSAGIAIVRAQEEELSNQIQKILAEQQKDQSGGFHSAIVDLGRKTLEKLRRQSREKSNLLNPKRQLIRIFAVFLGSLICIMLFDLAKDPQFNLRSHEYDFLLLVFSVGLFAIGLLILQQIAWASIDAKNDIEKRALERERQKVTPSNDEMTPVAN